MDSPLILHIQHQSNTMICHFLVSSLVRIFPNMANQVKNTTRNGTLFSQILLQGKGVLSWGLEPNRMINFNKTSKEVTKNQLSQPILIDLKPTY